MTEIVEQKIVSGCKNPFRTFYIAVMHYGVWLLMDDVEEEYEIPMDENNEDEFEYLDEDDSEAVENSQE